MICERCERQFRTIMFLQLVWSTPVDLKADKYNSGSFWHKSDVVRYVRAWTKISAHERSLTTFVGATGCWLLLRGLTCHLFTWHWWLDLTESSAVHRNRHLRFCLLKRAQNKPKVRWLHSNLICGLPSVYLERVAMPRCAGRHSRQTCKRSATEFLNGVGRCVFHSIQRDHFLWFAVIAGCGICFHNVQECHLVEFYCCGHFYCYKCVIQLFDMARREKQHAKCPTCRWTS